MDEYENRTVETGDGQDAAVERQGTGGNAAETGNQTETNGQGEKGADIADQQKTEQNRKMNAMMAAARRQAEKETRERVTAERDEELAGMKIPNPTKPGEYFRSMAEMAEYSKALKRSNAEERAKREKRDVSEILEEDENREYLTRKRREEAARNKPNAQEEFIRQDIENFRERHPDEDIAKVDGNKAFRRFAGSRYGKEPLADLWDDFLDVTGNAKNAAVERQKDRSERSTGSGNSGKPVALTNAQQEMLDRWNENYPEMKMTAKEFLNR